MKKALLIIVFGAILTSYFSCRKCITCSYTFPYGISDTTIVYTEYCDKRSAIKLYERNIKALADSLDGTYFCE